MNKITCLILLIFLSPVFLISSIMLTNNFIANQTENELVSLPLPEDTELADSLSVANKIYGNGNGMQYIGELLIVSELTEEELTEYYQSLNENITVKRQLSPQVFDSEYYKRYKFKSFDADKSSFAVELIYYNPYTYSAEYNLFWNMLDLDLRAN